VVTYRAFTQFQDLSPGNQILVFGAPGVVLIIVSWAYSRRIARFRKAARDKAAARTHG
jgi:D-arabinose 1-dehydrogenase-like Zn-dependent alcohol dehydrogenase